jgi:hypothetical protein
MTGCGLSFVTMWLDDSKQVVGATGSLNFFFSSKENGVAAGLKLTGVRQGKLAPVSFAWADVKGYGKTTDFTPGKAEFPGAFISWKRSDAKSSLLPLMMSRSGFTLGVSFQGLPFDEVVQIPAAPEEVTKKVSTCIDELQAHIKRVFKG